MDAKVGRKPGRPGRISNCFRPGKFSPCIKLHVYFSAVRICIQIVPCCWDPRNMSLKGSRWSSDFRAVESKQRASLGLQNLSLGISTPRACSHLRDSCPLASINPLYSTFQRI